MSDAASMESLLSDPCVRVYEYRHADAPRVGDSHRLFPLSRKGSLEALVHKSGLVYEFAGPLGTVVRVLEGADHCGVDVYVRFPDREALEKAEQHGAARGGVYE